MRLVVISYGHAGKINQFSECIKSQFQGEEKNNKRPPGQDSGIAIMRNARRRTEPPYPTGSALWSSVCVGSGEEQSEPRASEPSASFGANLGGPRPGA